MESERAREHSRLKFPPPRADPLPVGMPSEARPCLPKTTEHHCASSRGSGRSDGAGRLLRAG
eukprot:9010024-Pyramimonas_sp.AAC.1